MSFKSKLTVLAAAAAMSVAGGIQAANALDEITVAYFLEWPTANQVAQMSRPTTRNWASRSTGAPSATATK